MLVELTEYNSRLYSLPLNVTAQLKPVSKTTPSSQLEATPTEKKQPVQHVSVAKMSLHQYKVSYTPVSLGQHKLHVQVNNREIIGSPFTVTVYADPRQLGNPVKTVTGMDQPHGIAFNSHQEMIVSEWCCHRLSIFDIRGHTIRTIGTYGYNPDQMVHPTGITTDIADNIYVCSEHKLQKFNGSGDLIKCLGQRGKKKGEFNDPHGVTFHNNQLYVCDRKNHRIQVFSLNLKFVQSTGSYGNGRGEFDQPFQVKFDTTGNMYIAECGNRRVQVLNTSGQFIRVFGQEGEGKLSQPSGLHVIDKYLYVSDYCGHCIVVYDMSGKFVSSFGKHGENKGEFRGPQNIASFDCFIYVSDMFNNRVQIWKS